MTLPPAQVITVAAWSRWAHPARRSESGTKLATPRAPVNRDYHISVGAFTDTERAGSAYRARRFCLRGPCAARRSHRATMWLEALGSATADSPENILGQSSRASRDVRCGECQLGRVNGFGQMKVESGSENAHPVLGTAIPREGHGG
jgi:hypothetical protein